MSTSAQPLDGPIKPLAPTAQPKQAIRITLPEEVVDAIQQASTDGASAEAPIRIQLDGSAKGMFVGSTHFPFSVMRDLSQEMYLRERRPDGTYGNLRQAGFIKRDFTIQRQLNTKITQKVQQRSHQVEDERKGRKAIWLDEVPLDVANAGKKRKATATAPKGGITKRMPLPTRPVAAAPALNAKTLSARPSAPSSATKIATSVAPSPNIKLGSSTSTPHPTAPLPVRSAAPSGTATPTGTGARSPLLTKIIHRLAHKSHTVKDLSKLIGAPKQEINKILTKVAWTIGAATNADNTVWSLKDESWKAVDLFSPSVSPPWNAVDRERIYSDVERAFKRLNLPTTAPEWTKLQEAHDRMKGKPAVSGLGISTLPVPEPSATGPKPATVKPAITVTPVATPDKVASKPAVPPVKSTSAPVSQAAAAAGPTITSSGIQIGGTLSSNFRGGQHSREIAKASGKKVSASKPVSKADESAPPVEAEIASSRPGTSASATKAKAAPAKITPTKADTATHHDKPTVSSAARQKAPVQKEKEKAKLETPDKPSTGLIKKAVDSAKGRATPVERPSSAAGRSSSATGRPSATDRPAAAGRPSALSASARHPDAPKTKEVERRKRPAEDEGEHGNAVKRRKVDEKTAVAPTRSAKEEVISQDRRMAPKKAVTKKEEPVQARKALSRKEEAPIERKAVARKDDSSLERKTVEQKAAAKKETSQERKAGEQLSMKKDTSQERKAAEQKSVKKFDPPAERKPAVKRKVDYSDDEEEVPLAKKAKVQAVGKEPEPRRTPLAALPKAAKPLVKPSTSDTAKAPAESSSKSAQLDKGKRRKPDYTSSEDEGEETRVVRRKTAPTAVAPRPEPKTAPVAVISRHEPPRPKAPLTRRDLEVKSLRKYATYVQLHARIFEQQQLYEDFAAGKYRDDVKMMDPKEMEELVDDWQMMHADLQRVHKQMDDMEAAAVTTKA